MEEIWALVGHQGNEFARRFVRVSRCVSERCVRDFLAVISVHLEAVVAAVVVVENGIAKTVEVDKEVEEEIMVTAEAVVEDEHSCQKNHRSQHSLVAYQTTPFKETSMEYLKI